ncbi:MAG: hypothetical protein RLN70_01730 [Rhodospirillaceae bacterium]
MHFVLDDEAWDGIEEHLHAIAEGWRNALHIWRGRCARDGAIGHLQEAIGARFYPAREAKHARDTVDSRCALAKQSQLVDGPQKHRGTAPINISVGKQEWQGFAPAGMHCDPGAGLVQTDNA